MRILLIEDEKKTSAFLAKGLRESGFTADVTGDGETGFAAPPDDVERFARYLTQLLIDDELRTRLSRRCREIALAEYSIASQVRRYLELFKQLSPCQDQAVPI